jgi:hypothetical protein
LLEEFEHRRRFAARENQAIQIRQFFGFADQDCSRAEDYKGASVGLIVALEGKYADCDRLAVACAVSVLRG